MKNTKRFLILTGMSGAGKSVALNSLEDMGYFCIDNMPPNLFRQILVLSDYFFNNEDLNSYAIVMDSRANDFEGILGAIEELKQKTPFDVKTLFLEASTEVLTKRFNETRRIHPLSKKGTTIEGIEAERTLLEEVKQYSDYIIDTSYMKANELKKEVIKCFQPGNHDYFRVNFMSFGFKHGTPSDCDYIFDVRFIKNPFYIDELRPLTGLDTEVSEYVLQKQEAKTYIEKTVDLLQFAIPQYKNIGKSQVVIGIGCSGGQHRSVAISQYLYNYFKDTFSTNIFHRDLEKRKGN
ncbi:RNase adapter RapZ [Haloplasma contractile]|nr:RNase adapter RapZ [Haloplasma contractile]